LEYEFDDPLRIQDPAEDNEVPMEPFAPDEEEFIARFSVCKIRSYTVLFALLVRLAEALSIRKLFGSVDKH
jgi:hypothetical protein